ncbi:3-hydroxyisobutyryl-CoA hydrolase [Microbacterium sediminis]|uniref:3-hydroxyisobutyryl-CoA hydrolase n=1 Tax=Microbacterium sediminis TaxID=904291 RepID=A0A1B9NE54_9MICO|nr:3-hydroxyisobutyryl-CoA hydrolase [Microbacterium sediminis]QBR75137.1 enoyl-CoA hydratase/isomerase family protein [Microbacterium sediminis]
MHVTSDRVLRARRNGVGRLTLNRPEAINAVDIDMVRSMLAALDAWRDDADVHLVLLDGVGDRGLCAGGDVRLLREHIVAGRFDAVEEFFRGEYLLNATIDEYPRPFVAFMDGVTMGGGIGISAHGSVRVVTERSRLAMPETRIGFTPDVGGTWLLGRAPGRLGEFLALTGWTMGAADAILCGLADHAVPAAHLPDLAHALETRADPATPNELVLLFDETMEPGPIERARPWIDEAFAGETVAEILERLRAMPETDGEITPSAVHAELVQRAPLALAVTLRAVRRARELPDLRAALAQEYGLVSWFVRTQPDMAEGIRAQVVDKDRSPRWNPATLEGVVDDMIDEAFAHRAPVPLWTDEGEER